MNGRLRGAVPVLIAAALLVAALAVSLGLYAVQKNHGSAVHVVGAEEHADRIDLDVAIIRIDAAAQELVMQMTPMARGALGDSDGRFRADTVLHTSGLTSEPITYRAGDINSGSELRVAIGGGGMITDYPFDKYDARMAFAGTSAGQDVPVVLDLYSLDAAFSVTAKPDTAYGADTVGAVLTVRRSTPSIVFAVFVMVLMLGLAWAAATAAFYVLSGRHGLIWPANTLMAAMLFAMVPLRNAVPGSPPIGSIIDFGSFFIAETVVALALICTVLVGYRQEMRKARATDR
ncbi:MULTISPECIES: DUF4436 family protein [unclassified Nocardia]|uniref:DUF4436 family protein n=1 Tax=unclassified Nocardia TaxID=2637762 RepID=UPI0035E2B188